MSAQRVPTKLAKTIAEIGQESALCPHRNFRLPRDTLKSFLVVGQHERRPRNETGADRKACQMARSDHGTVTLLGYRALNVGSRRSAASPAGIIRRSNSLGICSKVGDLTTHPTFAIARPEDANCAWPAHWPPDASATPYRDTAGFPCSFRLWYPPAQAEQLEQPAIIPHTISRSRAAVAGRKSPVVWRDHRAENTSINRYEMTSD
jgi:hypothetical protein